MGLQVSPVAMHSLLVMVTKFTFIFLGGQRKLWCRMCERIALVCYSILDIGAIIKNSILNRSATKEHHLPLMEHYTARPQALITERCRSADFDPRK